MKSRNAIRSVFVGLGLLAITGCQTLSDLTQTTELVGGRTEAQIAAEVCDLFRTQSYDRDLDTKFTADQIKAFNRARAAYCKGEDK